MRTIKNEITNLIEIKKSKFISFVFSVNSDDDVKQKLANLKKEYRDATHIVYAYTLFCPALEKCSDDGEPSGTAGKPILDVLKRNNLSNVLLVVIRYFGGIKLGAGGLVHAYANSAKEIVDKCGIKELQEHVIVNIKVNIDSKYVIDNNKNIKILDTDYSCIAGKVVGYKIAVIKNSVDYEKLQSITNEWDVMDEVMM